jgi:hypothetical protein
MIPIARVALLILFGVIGIKGIGDSALTSN